MTFVLSSVSTVNNWITTPARALTKANPALTHLHTRPPPTSNFYKSMTATTLTHTRKPPKIPSTIFLSPLTTSPANPSTRTGSFSTANPPLAFFSNPVFLRNIRPCTGACLRLVSNGGTLRTRLISDLPGFGEVWYDPTSLANILSLAAVRRVCRVTMDSHVDASFTVYKHNRTPLIFREHHTGLYYHDASAPTAPAYSFAIDTVADNQAHYTRRQVQGADLAKRLYALVGRPSHRNFTKMIQNNILANCPVTVDDANRAIKIYGPDIHAAGRGKTVKKKPKHIASNQHESIPDDILSDHRNVTISFDIFFVDKLPFILTVSRNIHFITVQHIPKHTIMKYVLPCLLKQVNNLYKTRGFNIVAMHADDEFTSLTDPLLELDNITLNIAAAHEHTPEAKRAIRTVKERNRATVSSLPYQMYPKLLKVEMIKHAATWLNMFPPTDGISSTSSSRTSIITGVKLNYNTHCRVPIGADCETHDDNNKERTNTEDPRTTPAIALNPTGNLQGSYHFMSLLTGERISRRRWSEHLATDHVISRVHDMAATEAHYDPNADDCQFSWNEDDLFPRRRAPKRGRQRRPTTPRRDRPTDVFGTTGGQHARNDFASARSS